MSFDPINSKKNYEIVMQQIKEKIESGQFMPGERLESVVELSKRFAVGRSTVREALSALKAMGWVQIKQGGGTFVSTELPQASPAPLGDALSQADSLLELLEVRKILETGCAALAAEKCSESDLRDLEAIIDDMLLHLRDDARSEQLDVQFHLKVAEIARNLVLLEMMKTLSARLHDSIKSSRALWFYGERASAQRLLEEHSSIVKAIRRGDPAAASETMLNHLQKVEKVLKNSGVRE